MRRRWLDSLEESLCSQSPEKIYGKKHKHTRMDTWLVTTRVFQPQSWAGACKLLWGLCPLDAIKLNPPT